MGASFISSCILAVCLLVRSSSGSIAVTNPTPLKVLLGRSVFVEPFRHLNVNFPRGSSCQVVVLQADPLSQRMGYLVPDVFRCDFTQGDVQYTHLGSKFCTEDFVRLQIRVDTNTETRFVPFTLHVSVVFSDMEIVRKNQPIVVPQVGGLSAEINNEVVAFNYDENSQSCRVVILNFRDGIAPRFGELVNVTRNKGTAAQYECWDFLNADIRYTHTKLNSANRDHVQMFVERKDKTTGDLKTEYFQMIVRILGASSNQSPVASFQASHTVEVKQYAMAPITQYILAASDPEIDEDEIIFNVTQPLGPGQGQLVHTDDPYQQVTAFYQKDVTDLKITYTPPVERSDNLRMFQVILKAVDDHSATSDPIMLLIMVKPTNIRGPVVTKNAGLSLFEGQSRPLSDKANLAVSDKDNLQDVRLSVIGGLKHGELRMLGKKIGFFMATDLELGVVMYHHDDSETYSDNILFRMSDGLYSVDFLFAVTIGAVDDLAPVLVHNIGLTLEEGGVVNIDRFMLSASDVDSDDGQIQFKVVPGLGSRVVQETVGVLCLRQQEPPTEVGWVLLEDGFYEKNVTHFFQENITAARLFYRHLGGEFFRDSIHFVLLDNADQPNVSPEQTFNIFINRVDDLSPELYPGCTLSLVADEGGTTEVSSIVLRYTDIDSPEKDLSFVISREPYFLDINSSQNAGDIVMAASGTRVVKFTQMEVNHRKIAFRAPDVELGLYPARVQLEFSVSDMSGNTISNQVLQIILEPVNNKAPEVASRTINLTELERVVIDDRYFTVYDEDTSRDQLRFTVASLPRYGVLRRGDTQLRRLTAFTVDDVIYSRLSYQHVTPGEASDEISLSVDDGVQHKAFLLEIVIIPKPKVVTSQIYNIQLKVAEHSQKVIKIPEVPEDESAERPVMLRLSNPPREGRVMRDGMPVRDVSIQDLRHGSLYYEHTGKETGLQGDHDLFNLTLSNQSDVWMMAGNRYIGVQVDLVILPVDNVAPVVNVLPLTVREGQKAQLTPRHVSVLDPDTRHSDVICMIDVQPNVGFLENVAPSLGSEKSNAGKRITLFKIQDVNAGNIYYVQDTHKGDEPKMDWLAFTCTDNSNTSPRYLLNIGILPRNDEEPQIFIREFMVKEGSDKIIDVTVLNAVDADVPMDELMFYVITPPKHGVIEKKGQPVKRFTLTQIRKTASIVYQHDGSETLRDSLLIGVTDGIHNKTRKVPIAILPVDDEEPTMAVNMGLRLKSLGESKTITPWNIRASDDDTPDNNLTFILRSPPRAGTLQLICLNGSVINLTQWSMFPQRAISSRQLVYTQNPSIPGARDRITFDVTDGLNTLVNQVFLVEVEDTDRVLPVVISKGVHLRQNSRVLLTTDFLSASDANSVNTDLRYVLTKPPQKGHLESVDAPGIAIQNFTQLDLAANRIVYVHSGRDEDTMDSFDFQVSDGTNLVKRKFLVTLLNVNNKRPVLIYTSGSVREGDTLLLTPFELRAEDQDTDGEHVLFDVSRVPLHGVLLKGGSPVSSFSQADINGNLISYVHDGTDTLIDSFRFSVRDGAHTHFFVFPDTDTPTNAIQEFRIAIRPVDNRFPQLTLNKGATNLHVLSDGRLGLVVSGDVLRAEDRDSDDSLLVYFITSPPESGVLVNNNKNASALNFTQSDLNLRRISYVLHSDSNATADSFGFIVKDPAGNTLGNQFFSLSWTWVSLERNAYDVHETDGILKVNLVRRGFLGHSSFVRMSARGITAKSRVDFRMDSTAHVQFSPGQSHAEWRLRIKDDVMYEVRKTLMLELMDARMCVIGRLHSAVVTITDPEDLPKVEVVHTALVVEENCGELRIPLQRIGDTSQRLQVLCMTLYTGEQGWATGASPTAVLSYSDFISRTEDMSSVVTFKTGETLKYCAVTVIDDTLYEEEEKFEVKLLSRDGSKVNPTRDTTEVIISPDPRDEPKISFERANHLVDESVGQVEVTLHRTGSDLSKTSSVFVRSRQLIPISARAGEDYDPLAKNVYFASHVTSQTLLVNILDDAGRPSIEGLEDFELVLRVPVNTGLGNTDTALITINDSFSDLPLVQFERSAYLTKESAGVFSVPLMRTGDLSLLSSVRCYTRQMTARVSEDFIERPDSSASIVTFKPGENRKECNVAIRNDVLYEGPEDFRLALRSVMPDVRIRGNNVTVITISDTEDKPIIQFSQSSVFVSEPLVKSLMAEAVVEVVKQGDLTRTSRVRIYTLDASAKAGIDYQPLTQILDFSGNVSRHQIILKILFNADRQLRRVFTVHLTSDLHGKSELRRSKVVVYIDKSSPNPAVTFPLQPRVVSLRQYDGVGAVPDEVVKGYPVICVTACNPKFPRYAETGALCRSQDVNNSLTQYRWQVALGHAKFRDLHDDTFFTRTDSVTLDGVYLTSGARVRCIARAVNSRGKLGLESISEPAVVSKKEGVCVARDSGHVGSDRFVPSIAFTGSRLDSFSNMVHIKVSIPHTDGLIPLISTKKFANFKRDLGPGVLRAAQHKCSNLLDVDEVQTRFGFVGRPIKDSLMEAEPYQFSADLRGNRTLRFYRNLDLQSCMWTFNAYYDISEIVQYCAATVTTDGASRDSSESQLTFRVPLFVSFVYRLSTTAGDWAHYDHAMFLRLSLTYDTGVLLKDGVKTLDGSILSGDLWPTSIRVRESDKRLVVKFKTKTKFRGIFMMRKAGTKVKAMVVSRDRPRLSFQLSLITSQMTLDYPLQNWQFESDFAVRDYTGVYYVKLIPCTASKDVQYSEPIPCNPRDAITFTLPIRFQQINDPVPAQFTLSAQFHLFSLKERWLSPQDLAELDGDIVFSKESKIFGRISLIEGDSLGRGRTGYIVSVEKIYLCAGMKEYTPSYDPQNHKFGCLADENYLVHRLKILDKEEPNSVKTDIGNIPFEAKFASDDPDATPLTKRLDSDGFVLNSAPLFEVPSDRKWFMHAVYSVTSKKKTTNHRSSRDTEETGEDLHKREATMLYQITKPMHRRDAENIEEIGNNGKGTNLKMIRLIRDPADDRVRHAPGGHRQREDAGSTNTHDQGLVNPLVIGIAVVCGVLLVALVVVGVVLKRKLRSPPPAVVETNKEEVATTPNEGTRV